MMNVALRKYVLCIIKQLNGDKNVLICAFIYSVYFVFAGILPPFSSLLTVCQCLTPKNADTTCTRGTTQQCNVPFSVL